MKKLGRLSGWPELPLNKRRPFGHASMEQRLRLIDAVLEL